MNAIVKEEPPELSDSGLQISPGLERIIRRCLEKAPERRFQSASDLAFAIEALSGTSGSSTAQKAIATHSKLRRRIGWLATALVLIVGAVAFLIGVRFSAQSPPTFQQVAFGPGFISSARFTPDGASVIYGAAWSGKPINLFSARLGGLGSRSLDLPPADVLAISATGDMAILLNRHHYFQWMTTGTLALAPLSGGAARPLLENVSDADITADGKQLAVARFDNDQQVLEFPIGKPLYRTNGWIDRPAIAPDGKQVAFLEHPIKGDDRGYVVLVDGDGKVRRLTQEWSSVKGLAWSRKTGELWFTADISNEATALRAVSPSGRQRVLLTAPGDLWLRDVNAQGQVLLLTVRSTSEIAIRRPGQTADRLMNLGTNTGAIYRNVR